MKVLIILLMLITQSVYADKNRHYEELAQEIIENIIKDQVDNIINIVNSNSSENERNIKGYVLSTHIRTFSDISENINEEIRKQQNEIKTIIRLVATDIEINKGNGSGSLTIDDSGSIFYEARSDLPRKLDIKREKLLAANLANSVSVRSADMAIRLLASINGELMSRARKSQTRLEKEKIYMSQAIYVYEMADIVLDILNSLSLEGETVIRHLYSDAKKRISTRIDNIQLKTEELKSLKEEGLLSEENLFKTEKSYNLLKQANKEGLKSWEKLIDKIGKQGDFLVNLKTKTKLIKHKRDMAKIQIETLRDLRELADLRDTIGSLNDLVSSVSSLDLLVLDELTIRKLLGYSTDEKWR